MKTRWKLIAMGGLLVLLGGLNALQHRAVHSSSTSNPAEVAILRAGSWPASDSEVDTLVRQAVALTGGGDTGGIKPNLVWGAAPHEGYTTDPRVGRAVVEMAREVGAAHVVIADGSALYRDGHDARGATLEAFPLCGYDADGDMVDDATGAPMVDLNDTGGLDQFDPTLVRQVTLQNGLIWTTHWLPNVILDADVLIGVQVLKNHISAGTTLALKNQIGVAPSGIYHKAASKMYRGMLSHSAGDLGRHVVDINLARPLDFAILDGLRGMTDGPIGGALADQPMRLILASRDPVALDTVGARVMGYDPATVPYLAWAAGVGLGTNDVAQISVRGLRVSEVRRDFPAPFGDPQAQRADSDAPTVTITVPTEGLKVLEDTIVGATASGDGAISRVEFYVFDALQSVATAPPYQAALELTALQGQTVTLRAVAYDLALNDAEDSHTVTVVEAAAPGMVSFHTATHAIATYPYAQHLELRFDGPYPYHRLNWSQYGNPSPSLREYEVLVLENDYLRVTLLPELGGRIYQMIFKPTGHNELYQNPVVKPTHWGPLTYDENWWLAAGGIEWCLPVEEHGYDWGKPWTYQVISSTVGVTVTLRNTTAADRLRAEVAVHLPVRRAYLEIRPRLENPTGSNLDYKYWSNAMLAPGPSNTVGADLHFILGADEVTVHSRGDEYLPDAGQAMDWPEYGELNYARLGNWNKWLGFFERPQAADNFVGVYDAQANEGVVRVFPASVARGSKGLGMGWSNKIDPNNWTDDGSTYVEIHGGVAPTYWDRATIAAGQSLEWTEYWYPVSEIGWLSAATDEAALGVHESDGRFTIGVHVTAPHADGASTLYAWRRGDCTELDRWDLPIVGPAAPALVSTPRDGRLLSDIGIVYVDDEEHLLAAVNFVDCLPPRARIESLPSTVVTPTFAVRWGGADAWSPCPAQTARSLSGAEWH